jgi:hypothetical protein
LILQMYANMPDSMQTLRTVCNSIIALNLVAPSSHIHCVAVLEQYSAPPPRHAPILLKYLNATSFQLVSIVRMAYFKIK